MPKTLHFTDVGRTAADHKRNEKLENQSSSTATSHPSSSLPSYANRPQLYWQQSLLPTDQVSLIDDLPEANDLWSLQNENLHCLWKNESPSTNNTVTRKIWLRRMGSSATSVPIKEDDLVDDIRASILKKYANTLDKHFDGPDITIRIRSRAHEGER